MNLPKVIADLVKAQDNFDSLAYANCFSETAVVFDEGKSHNGRIEIQHWISEANKNYQATMQPIAFSEQGGISVLTTNISGSFAGSPIVLKYHFELEGELIKSLKITG